MLDRNVLTILPMVHPALLVGGFVIKKIGVLAILNKYGYPTLYRRILRVERVSLRKLVGHDRYVLQRTAVREGSVPLFSKHW